jgi:cysteine desulfurase
MGSSVYLDYNASAPLRPEARAAMLEAWDAGGNASSVHRSGRTARRRLEEARTALAARLETPSDRIVFTSGATEANALALGDPLGRTVLVSAVEHDSVLAWSDAEPLPVDASGRVDLDRLDRRLAASDLPALLSVMAANNETGVVQPMAAVVAIAKARGARIHCDATQAIGRIAILPWIADVDLVSLSAHKIGGPQGVGALVIRDGGPVGATMRGGAQEGGRRAGTENVAGACGFAAAIEVAMVEQPAEAQRLGALRDALERALVAEGGIAIGVGAERLPNTLCIAMPRVPAETQVVALDLAGVAVSAGSACGSGKVRRSHVLKAMRLPAEVADCAIRISLGVSTGADEIERCRSAWVALARRRLGRAAGDKVRADGIVGKRHARRPTEAEQ